MVWLRKPRFTTPTRKPSRLGVEKLEAREVLYSATANAWPNPQLITIGFVPDGTIVGANANGYIYSNLISAMNAKFSTPATWQNEILKAAQVWAQQTNINFALITDNGANIGEGDYQQGDPNMADIRIGGYDFGTTTLAQAYMPPPVNNYSIAGDIQFNTNRNWNVGGGLNLVDLFSVASHEIGHVLGLDHSNVITSTMYAAYAAAKPTLNADDISGIRNIYSANATRAMDSYDQAASNGTFAAASTITSLINTTTKQALGTGLDLSTSGDKDFYKFVLPTGLGGTMNLTLRTDGLSLLSPKVTVYASNQTTVLGSATAAGDRNGATLSVSVNGLTAGSTYFVVVETAETGTGSWQAFSTGKYALAMGFAGVAVPSVPLPNTQELNGIPIQGGGGQAVVVDQEVRANTYTTGAQDTFVASAMKAVAIDSSGNYVVVWTSAGQDGSGKGVYGQRFNATGGKIGSEFRINTTTFGDQEGATVAMDALGNFVVTWTSNWQDGSGKGIYLQRFNASGVKQGGEVLVNTATFQDQEGSSVAMDASGNFVVTWTSWDADGSMANVYGQRFSLLGTKLGGQFLVNTTTAMRQQWAQVAMNGLGLFVVVWESEWQNGAGFDIYAQRYDITGAKLGGEFLVNSTTTFNQSEAAVAMDAVGNFVVTWTSEWQDGSTWGIYAQRFNASGTKLGGEFGVNTITANDQVWPTVAMDALGNYLITWTGWDNFLSGYNIHAQQYNAGGALIGTEIQVNTTEAGGQYYSSAAMNLNGQAVVSWYGQGSGDTDGVFTQRYAINSGNGLHNLEAGVPHGYGPDGCGCGDHETHAHREADGDDGCGCGTCSTSAAFVAPGAGRVWQVQGSPAGRSQLAHALLALTDGGAVGGDSPRQQVTRVLTPPLAETAPSQAPAAVPTVAGASRSPVPGSGSFSISSPAFGFGGPWLSPLTWEI